MLLSMDMRLSVRRGIDRGLNLFWRERKWGTTFTMLLCIMVLLQLLIICLLSLEGVRALLRSQSGIHLEVIKTAQDQDIQELNGALKALPYVDGVSYIPREKAYENEKMRDRALIESLE